MHTRPSDPVSRILKYVSSAVHQTDVLQYDSQCSFAVLSAELWGADVSSECTAQSRPNPVSVWGLDESNMH